MTLIYNIYSALAKETIIHWAGQSNLGIGHWHRQRQLIDLIDKPCASSVKHLSNENKTTLK
jgi:hypothetical protein